MWIKKRIKFSKKENYWAIGIYRGSSPFEMGPDKKIRNPVLSAADVTDVVAEFVADPFMVREGNTWYMFFEVMRQRGEIGMATSSDGERWTYRQIVLAEPFHLSYPYVFKHGDDYYMIPECKQTKSIRLYKAAGFPIRWELCATLLEGDDYTDTSVVYHNGVWWMFTALSCDVLQLYYADSLTGPWQRHTRSPIVMGDFKKARPAGRLVVYDGKILRLAQDDSDGKYGQAVNAFEIVELTKSEYRERPAKSGPVLQPDGIRWTQKGMHNLDLHQVADQEWIACVDGNSEHWVLRPPRLAHIVRKMFRTSAWSA